MSISRLSSKATYLSLTSSISVKKKMQFWEACAYLGIASFTIIGMMATASFIFSRLPRNLWPGLTVPQASMSTMPSGTPMADPKEEYKMVLLIRQDLEMTKGKIAAQCCHAAIASYEHCSASSLQALKKWKHQGQAKVTLKVKDEQELMDLVNKARDLSLPVQVVRDAGRTQIAAGSKTVAAIGPGPLSVINYVTGHLKLY